ncbi:unnamed protein product [Amoebophrya sp. A120]|nr:unnamed protein product [Amoebophrya sp. A120]|eukprot:GSA120T00008126001.1
MTASSHYEQAIDAQFEKLVDQKYDKNHQKTKEQIDELNKNLARGNNSFPDTGYTNGTAEDSDLEDKCHNAAPIVGFDENCGDADLDRGLLHTVEQKVQDAKLVDALRKDNVGENAGTTTDTVDKETSLLNKCQFLEDELALHLRNKNAEEKKSLLEVDPALKGDWHLGPTPVRKNFDAGAAPQGGPDVAEDPKTITVEPAQTGGPQSSIKAAPTTDASCSTLSSAGTAAGAKAAASASTGEGAAPAAKKPKAAEDQSKQSSATSKSQDVNDFEKTIQETLGDADLMSDFSNWMKQVQGGEMNEMEGMQEMTEIMQDPLFKEMMEQFDSVLNLNGGGGNNNKSSSSSSKSAKAAKPAAQQAKPKPKVKKEDVGKMNTEDILGVVEQSLQPKTSSNVLPPGGVSPSGSAAAGATATGDKLQEQKPQSSQPAVKKGFFNTSAKKDPAVKKGFLNNAAGGGNKARKLSAEKIATSAPRGEAGVGAEGGTASAAPPASVTASAGSSSSSSSKPAAVAVASLPPASGTTPPAATGESGEALSAPSNAVGTEDVDVEMKDAASAARPSEAVDPEPRPAKPAFDALLEEYARPPPPTHEELLLMKGSCKKAKGKKGKDLFFGNKSGKDFFLGPGKGGPKGKDFADSFEKGSSGRGPMDSESEDEEEDAMFDVKGIKGKGVFHPGEDDGVLFDKGNGKKGEKKGKPRLSEEEQKALLSPEELAALKAQALERLERDKDPENELANWKIKQNMQKAVQRLATVPGPLSKGKGKASAEKVGATAKGYTAAQNGTTVLQQQEQDNKQDGLMVDYDSAENDNSPAVNKTGQAGTSSSTSSASKVGTVGSGKGNKDHGKKKGPLGTASGAKGKQPRGGPLSKVHLEDPRRHGKDRLGITAAQKAFNKNVYDKTLDDLQEMVADDPALAHDFEKLLTSMLGTDVIQEACTNCAICLEPWLNEFYENRKTNPTYTDADYNRYQKMLKCYKEVTVILSQPRHKITPEQHAAYRKWVEEEYVWKDIDRYCRQRYQEEQMYFTENLRNKSYRILKNGKLKEINVRKKVALKHGLDYDSDYVSGDSILDEDSEDREDFGSTSSSSSDDDSMSSSSESDSDSPLGGRSVVRRNNDNDEDDQVSVVDDEGNIVRKNRKDLTEKQRAAIAKIEDPELLKVVQLQYEKLPPAPLEGSKPARDYEGRKEDVKLYSCKEEKWLDRREGYSRPDPDDTDLSDEGSLYDHDSQDSREQEDYSSDDSSGSDSEDFSDSCSSASSDERSDADPDKKTGTRDEKKKEKASDENKNDPGRRERQPKPSKYMYYTLSENDLTASDSEDADEFEYDRKFPKIESDPDDENYPNIHTSNWYRNKFKRAMRLRDLRQRADFKKIREEKNVKIVKWVEVEDYLQKKEKIKQQKKNPKVPKHDMWWREWWQSELPVDELLDYREQLQKEKKHPLKQEEQKRVDLLMAKLEQLGQLPSEVMNMIHERGFAAQRAFVANEKSEFVDVKRHQSEEGKKTEAERDKLLAEELLDKYTEKRIQNNPVLQHKNNVLADLEQKRERREQVEFEKTMSTTTTGTMKGRDKDGDIVMVDEEDIEEEDEADGTKIGFNKTTINRSCDSTTTKPNISFEDLLPKPGNSEFDHFLRMYKQSCGDLGQQFLTKEDREQFQQIFSGGLFGEDLNEKDKDGTNTNTSGKNDDQEDSFGKQLGQWFDFLSKDLDKQLHPEVVGLNSKAPDSAKNQDKIEPSDPAPAETNPSENKEKEMAEKGLGAIFKRFEEEYGKSDSLSSGGAGISAAEAEKKLLAEMQAATAGGATGDENINPGNINNLEDFLFGAKGLFENVKPNFNEILRGGSDPKSSSSGSGGGAVAPSSSAGGRATSSASASSGAAPAPAADKTGTIAQAAAGDAAVANTKPEAGRSSIHAMEVDEIAGQSNNLSVAPQQAAEAQQEPGDANAAYSDNMKPHRCSPPRLTKEQRAKLVKNFLDNTDDHEIAEQMIERLQQRREEALLKRAAVWHKLQDKFRRPPTYQEEQEAIARKRRERRKRRKEEFEKIRFKSKKRPAATGEEGKDNGSQEHQQLDGPHNENDSTTSSKKTINLLGGFTSVTVENEQHKKDAAVAKEAKRAKKSKWASKNRISAEDKARSSTKKNKRSITARSRGNYVDDGAQEIDVQINASNVKKQKQNRSASQEEKSKQGLEEQSEQVIIQGSVWCFPKVVTSHRNYNLDKDNKRTRRRNMRPVKKVVYAECTEQERENLKKNDPDAFRRVKSGVGATVPNSALGEEVVQGIDEQTSSPRPVRDLSDKTFIIMKPKNKNPVATTSSTSPLKTHGEQQDKDCKVQ